MYVYYESQRLINLNSLFEHFSILIEHSFLLLPLTYQIEIEDRWANRVETGIVELQNDGGTLNDGLTLEQSVSGFTGNKNQCSSNVTKEMAFDLAWCSHEKISQSEQFQELRDNDKKIEQPLEQTSSKMEEMIKKIELRQEQM